MKGEKVGLRRHALLVFLSVVMAMMLLPASAITALGEDAQASATGQATTGGTTVSDTSTTDEAVTGDTSAGATDEAATDATADEAATDAADSGVTALAAQGIATDTAASTEAASTADTALTTEALPDGATVWDGSIDTSWYNTTDTTFTLSTPAQLAGLAAITSPKSYDDPTDSRVDGIVLDNFAGKTVKLGADLYMNAAAISGATIGSAKRFDPISDFNNWGGGGQGTSTGTYDNVHWQGTLDGCGHVIYNLYIDGSVHCSANFGGYQGLISGIGLGGVVKDLGVTGSYIYGRVGGTIVGCSNMDDRTASASQWPLIENCFSNGTFSGNGSSSRCSGGIVGAEDSNRINVSVVNCYVRGTTGNAQAGGIVGAIDGTVANCYNTGIVTGTYTGAVCSQLYVPSTTSPSNVGQLINSYALEGTNANTATTTERRAIPSPSRPASRLQPR